MSRAKNTVSFEPQPQKQPEPVAKIPERRAIVEKLPEVKEKPPVVNEIETKLPIPEQKISKPQMKYKEIRSDEDVLPMFSRVAAIEKNSSLNDDEESLERKVFTIAVRLVGLYMLYQFIVALPDLIILINSSINHSTNFYEALSKELIITSAKFLFHFVIGIYLIASGRILIRLLPRR